MIDTSPNSLLDDLDISIVEIDPAHYTYAGGSYEPDRISSGPGPSVSVSIGISGSVTASGPDPVTIGISISGGISGSYSWTWDTKPN